MPAVAFDLVSGKQAGFALKIKCGRFGDVMRARVTRRERGSLTMARALTAPDKPLPRMAHFDMREKLQYLGRVGAGYRTRAVLLAPVAAPTGAPCYGDTMSETAHRTLRGASCSSAAERHGSMQ